MTPHLRRRLVRSAAPAFLLALSGLRRAEAASVPEPSAFRAAFEAQFPKSPPSAAALALEGLAAKLGLSLVPRKLAKDGTFENAPFEKGRAEPAPEDLADQRDRGTLAGGYVSTEIASPRDRIGNPAAPLVRYLEEHAGDLDSVRSVLLGNSEISWEVDVSQKDRAPWPNASGIVRLERLLLARALLEARAGIPTEALGSVEACWRLNEALSSRPELVSQLVAVTGAKLVAGILRKIDAPAYEWSDRLRSGDVLAGVIAAFENQIWQIDSDATDLTGKAGVSGRIFQRVGEAFRERSRCGWTDSSFQTIADEAVSEEPPDPQNPVFSLAIPNLMVALFRAARFEVDAELTALVLDARIEREALRRRHWPGKLWTLGKGVCSEQPWSYKALRNGTVRIAFEGVLPEDFAPTRLSLEFVAGTPPRARHHRRTPRRRLVHRSTVTRAGK